MAVTIKDVARAAGVSASTVSRVLNNKGVISEETRKRIWDTMKELEYVPNDVARSFANGSARAFALVIDVVDVRAYANNFFNNTVFGIETAAHENGYNLMITNEKSVEDEISPVQKLVLGKKIDGIVIPISMAGESLLEKLNDLGFPSVILGHLDEGRTETSWVDINNTQGGALAVRHLIKKGYRNIAFLYGNDKEQFNQDRLTGYSRGVSAGGMEVKQELICHGLSGVEDSRECVLGLLRQEDRPDAVVCGDDRLALGALRAAKAAGVAVPRDFGIVSFDNTPLTELADIPITSLDVDTFELGRQAAEILIQQIEEPEASFRQVLLSTKIIGRASTERESGEEKM